MDYYRRDLTLSPIEPLLDQLEASEAAAANKAASDVAIEDVNIPTIEDFMDVEDIIRECRGDNKRLIAYLCRPDIVRALVTHCVTAPINNVPTDKPATPDTQSDHAPAQDSADEEPSNDKLPSESAEEPEPTNDQEEEEVRDFEDDEELGNESQNSESNMYKYTYVASELLSADIRELCDVVVGDSEVMDIIFACLEGSPAGELNSVVATHFSKVLVSLLKTRNFETIEQMKRRGRTVTDGLIKHICIGPISELLVHLLDAPENERTYAQTVLPPSEGALCLLAQADVLNGLANCFVQASNATAAPSETESASERRQREETMANVTATIIGLTERILQLPPLGVTIPKQLSPYHTPKAISRLLDAGLYAAGVLKDSVAVPSEEPGTSTATSGLTRDTVVAGNNSALLHSLGLAATLMTTKSNLWDTERANYLDSEKADSTNSNEGQDEDRDEESSVVDDPERGHEDTPIDVVHVTTQGSLLRPKTSGGTIISTSLLENELVVRFQRLFQLFGTNDGDESSKLPLGSLRLKLAEFFAACMKMACRSTVEHIVELSVPQKLLELFLRYEWSSMLHGVVSASIVSALESGAAGCSARAAWFNANIITWLLDAWSSNEQKENGEKCGFRAGYMGHLIKIGAALRDFFDFTEKEKIACLVDDETVQLFQKFVDERLAPAHKIEATPLCDDDDSDDDSDPVIVDDPRDLLDMGVGEVIEGLTQGDANIAIERFSKFLLHKSNMDEYDDEEIHAVDVGDLSHFGADDGDVEVTHNRIDVDHDLPPEMQEQQHRGSSADIRQTTPAESVLKSGLKTESTNGIIELRDEDQDDGSYNSFVRAPGDTGQPAEIEQLTAGFQDSVQIVEPLSVVEDADDVIVPIPSPSIEVDSAVTEIDEPSPLTPALVAEKHNVTTLKNDAEADTDSSDEEVSEWVPFDADELAGKAKSSSSDTVATTTDSQTAAEAAEKDIEPSR